jgi:hypothetical protein
MSFFNAFNSFSPFCHQNLVNPSVNSAVYGLVTSTSVQIVNIQGNFTSLNVIRVNLSSNTPDIVSTLVPIFSSGMTYTDVFVSPNVVYSYQLQAVIGGIYGKIFKVPYTITTLVNYINTIDTNQLIMYYSFENSSIAVKPTQSASITSCYDMIDTNGLVIYYHFDY